jgi:drug/metabolite transporter (DMT)-like permease
LFERKFFLPLPLILKLTLYHSPFIITVLFFGEIIALSVALCWTASAVFFELAGRKIGSISVNIIRLGVSFILLGVTLLVTKQSFIPMDATSEQWFWLGLSGIIGLFLGDMLLFRSYVLIGSRTSALVMSLVPAITTLVSWFFLHETLPLKSIIAIVVSMSGIMIAVADKRMRLNVPIKGVLLAFGGATGQSLGLILSKKGIGTDYDPIAATQIRILFALIGFVLLMTYTKRWHRLRQALTHRKAFTQVSIGSFVGLYLGVSLSLLAIQHTKTGIASTFKSLVPIFIILPSALIFKEKIKVSHVIGAIVSVIGVALFFI